MTCRVKMAVHLWKRQTLTVDWAFSARGEKDTLRVSVPRLIYSMSCCAHAHVPPVLRLRGLPLCDRPCLRAHLWVRSYLNGHPWGCPGDGEERGCCWCVWEGGGVLDNASILFRHTNWQTHTYTHFHTSCIYQRSPRRHTDPCSIIGEALLPKVNR